MSQYGHFGDLKTLQIPKSGKICSKNNQIRFFFYKREGKVENSKILNYLKNHGY